MNINFEKMPADVFDWIEHYSFEQLNVAQQQEVLRHLSVDIYNEMHDASVSLKAVSELRVEPVGERKGVLLDHFDRHHSGSRNTIVKGLVVWQAAAVFLLMLSGWLFYQVFDLKKEPLIQQVASIDTVYVDREVRSAPEVIHDTVYRYKEVRSNAPQSAYYLEEPEEEDLAPIREFIDAPALDLENLNTVPKGNSMKDDSLLRKFGFISI